MPQSLALALRFPPSSLPVSGGGGAPRDITTEAADPLLTEAGDNLITES